MVCPNCGTLNSNASENCRKCARTLHPASMKGKIPCNVHANREAVTSCGVCGIRLCAACAISHNGIDYCDGCAPAQAVRPDFDADYVTRPVVDVSVVGRSRVQERAVAFLIDAFLFLVGGLIFGIILFLVTGNTTVYNPGVGAPFYIFWTCVLLGWVVYNAISTGLSGQTLGRRVSNVIVLRPDGQIVDARTAALRAIASLLSLLPLGLGYLWAFFDPLRETWHDKMAKTAVYDYEEVS